MFNINIMLSVAQARPVDELYSKSLRREENMFLISERDRPHYWTASFKENGLALADLY